MESVAHYCFSKFEGVPNGEEEEENPSEKGAQHLGVVVWLPAKTR